MYIFLDESKTLHKNWWKFILAGIVTSLKPWTIDRIYYDFLRYKNIREVWGEVKSFDKKYRNKIDWFYDYIKWSVYWKQIQFIGIYSKNYTESWENYYHSLKELIYHTVKYTYIDKKNFNSISIIADNIKLNYSDSKIKNLLNQEKTSSRNINDILLFFKIQRNIDE